MEPVRAPANLYLVTVPNVKSDSQVRTAQMNALERSTVPTVAVAEPVMMVYQATPRARALQASKEPAAMSVCQARSALTAQLALESTALAADMERASTVVPETERACATLDMRLLLVCRVMLDSGARTAKTRTLRW